LSGETNECQHPLDSCVFHAVSSRGTNAHQHSFLLPHTTLHSMHEHSISRHLIATYTLWLDFAYIFPQPSQGSCNLSVTPKSLTQVQCHVAVLCDTLLDPTCHQVGCGSEYVVSLLLVTQSFQCSLHQESRAWLLAVSSGPWLSMCVHFVLHMPLTWKARHIGWPLVFRGTTICPCTAFC